MGDDEGTEQRLRASAEALVEAHFRTADPSHDVNHVHRVVALALLIADSVSDETKVDLLVVELAALFHDLTDIKYLPKGAAPISAEEKLEKWFRANPGLSDKQRALICRVVDNVSFSKEVKRRVAGEDTDWHRTCIELHCVQDADKLDALGAIGIMRCAAYSVVANRPLLPPSGDPTAACALAHFDEKLFKLKDMMKMAKGHQVAQSRDAFMRSFVSQCNAEASIITSHQL